LFKEGDRSVVKWGFWMENIRGFWVGGGGLYCGEGWFGCVVGEIWGRFKECGGGKGEGEE
jgi:hypothetical protein